MIADSLHQQSCDLQDPSIPPIMPSMSKLSSMMPSITSSTLLIRSDNTNHHTNHNNNKASSTMTVVVENTHFFCSLRSGTAIMTMTSSGSNSRRGTSSESLLAGKVRCGNSYDGFMIRFIGDIYSEKPFVHCLIFLLRM